MKATSLIAIAALLLLPAAKGQTTNTQSHIVHKRKHVAQTATAAPQEAVEKDNALQRCKDGFEGVAIATGVATTIGCAFDFFLTGGLGCMALISAAAANAPLALGTGCAVSVIVSSKAGTEAGAAVPSIPVQQ